MNDIPYFAHTEKEALSPEKRKEVEAEAERMYREYKEQCKLGRKPKTLGRFNPYELNFDFIESIPEDEWKELIKLHNKRDWKTWLLIILIILGWVLFGNRCVSGIGVF
tara:strand:- start:600 stop:923 length:324 start_codon:yes stop_codon:yes gene_type:complete